MDEKTKRKLAAMVGKLPEHWETMSLEQKITALDKKAELLFDGNDMYFLDLGYRMWSKFEAVISIEANEDHQFTEYGSCFALTNPVEKGKFDITAFPEYLRNIIEEQADENWENNEKDYNILSCGHSAATFAEAVEKMYIMLDLLTCGYELTEREWFEEKHPNLYPPEEDEDLDFEIL